MNPTGQEIKAHDGAVWQVSWAHPKFGVLLASASFDSKGNFGPFLRENQFIFFFSRMVIDGPNQIITWWFESKMCC